MRNNEIVFCFLRITVCKRVCMLSFTISIFYICMTVLFNFPSLSLIGRKSMYQRKRDNDNPPLGVTKLRDCAGSLHSMEVTDVNNASILIIN